VKLLRPTRPSLHWVLDVLFREDHARLRKGHGAQNMAIVRHFALNLVRRARAVRSCTESEDLIPGCRGRE